MSDPDVEAELAKSVRALAESQGEVELWKQSRDVADQHRVGLSARVIGAEAEADRLRGDLERARGLLARWTVAIGTIEELDQLESETFAFLAPPTPTASPEPEDPYCELAASEIPNFGTNRDTHRCAKLHRDKPEPDRASPEVTAKETSK